MNLINKPSLKVRIRRFWVRFKHKYLKWKLIDTSKYTIIPKNTLYFILSDKEYEKANNIENKWGYLFVTTGIGDAVYIETREHERIEITDYDTW